MFNEKSQWRNMMEIIAPIASQILSSLDDGNARAVGVVLSGGLTVWQAWTKKNAGNFEGKFMYELRFLDQRKLDRTFIHSDQFKEFVLRIIQNASETASEEKHEAFARLITRGCSPEGFQDKQLLRRLFDQISEIELSALRAVHDAQIAWSMPTTDAIHSATDQVMNGLHWSKDDALTATEGLRQLQLLIDVDGLSLNLDEKPVWISEIGRRLIAMLQPGNE
jgi:hypothetical protein